ncbi:MAG: macro domain-containing protein [Kangiellaceae bacterium]|nr:macro domain-containing protein [Kangiellaceae bacterium]MCW9018267.1 macro domain-containing protein [Kangiellaceae bacterium]
MKKVIKGDLIAMAESGHFDVIVHGCNCLCSMGNGIARTIRDKYPQVYSADKKTEKGDRSKLGNYSSSLIEGNTNFVVINAYTQFDYSRTRVCVDYEAVRSVFRKIKKDFSGMRIGYPLIGAGLAGGNWNVLEKIIKEELEGENHTLVKFVPPEE